MSARAPDPIGDPIPPLYPTPSCSPSPAPFFCSRAHQPTPHPGARGRRGAPPRGIARRARRRDSSRDLTGGYGTGSDRSVRARHRLPAAVARERRASHGRSDRSAGRRRRRLGRDGVAGGARADGRGRVRVITRSDSAARRGGGGGGDDDDDDRGAGSSDEGDIDPSLYDEEDEDECHESPNTEYWGELSKGVLANGNANRAETARACCESCKKNDVVCNAWVWDPSSRACWMKKTTAYQPPAYDPAKITFTSGALHPAQPRYAPAKSKGLNGASSRDPPFCLHTMITSNGQPYMNWQTRVFYQTWREAASARVPLRHFTRVLHRTRDDELVNEIHTVRSTRRTPSATTAATTR